MKKIPVCKSCGDVGHYAISCRKTPRKPIKSSRERQGEVNRMTIQSNEARSINCKYCSNSFETYATNRRYCSIDCAKKARSAQTLEKNNRAAVHNKEKFGVKYGIKSGKITSVCSVCKKEYIRYASQIKHRGSAYCSVSCKSKGQSKKMSKSMITKKLDTAYSQYIRNKYAIDGYVACVTCGKSDEVRNMQNGHYVSRRFYSTRWNDKNCHPQCYSCNVGLSGNYAQYTLFMIDTYGAGIIQELVDASREVYRATPAELLEKIDYYKNILAQKS